MEHHEAVRKFETFDVERGRSRPRSGDRTGGFGADPDDRELSTARTAANKGEPQAIQRISRIVGEGQRDIALGDPKFCSINYSSKVDAYN